MNLHQIAPPPWWPLIVDPANEHTCGLPECLDNLDGSGHHECINRHYKLGPDRWTSYCECDEEECSDHWAYFPGDQYEGRGEDPICANCRDGRHGHGVSA